MESDKSNYCRLCAGLKPNSKLINLQSDDEKRRDIVNKLRRINAGSFEVFQEDLLPKTVCFICCNTLENTYSFVINIEHAQAILRDLIPVRQIKSEPTNVNDKNSDTELDFAFDSDNVAIKEEEKQENQSFFEDLQNSKRQKKKGAKKNNDLDAIPLSQLKLTWKDYNWTCSYCDTQFTTISDLKLHSIQFHHCCNAFKCIDCNIRKLRLDNFLSHVKRHRKYLKLSCYVCSIKFATISESKRHKVEHSDSEFVCAGCNTSFPSEDDLTQHSNDFYRNRRSRQIALVNSFSSDGLTCIICKKTFKHKGSLNTHLLTHTERKRDHTCDKCGKCFLNKQNLAGHMLLHDDVRPYVCKICKFGFKTVGQLRSHVGVHDGHKPFACDQCGRRFRLQKQLKSHHIIHTDALPYVCSYCNKGFRFKTILNQHVRQHTGVKPYSCEQCQRDFTNWPNYNKHMKRRHGMDMAKKKHTPDGLYPINPTTGDVIIYPESVNTKEWKKEMMKQRRPGRPKIKVEDENNHRLDETRLKKNNMF